MAPYCLGCEIVGIEDCSDMRADIEGVASAGEYEFLTNLKAALTFCLISALIRRLESRTKVEDLCIRTQYLESLVDYHHRILCLISPVIRNVEC